ncbi:MAG: phage major capsid protein [Chloroflexota bacterium]|nr:phage major capsid protein [Chloroflexota bacterium]
MTPRQKLELAMSRNRARIRELLALDEVTEEQRTELDTLTQRAETLEVDYRAAVVAYPDPVEVSQDGPEQRELAQLTQDADAGEIMTAVLEHRATSGREAELQQHHGLNHNQIPLSMLFEQRAVTPAPSDVGTNQRPIIPQVFPASAAAFLGIDMPTVGVGEVNYPVLTTGATVGTPAEGAAQAETTGAFSATVLEPARLQASFFYSREDRARFSGMDSALRMNLEDALTDALDKQILAGTNGLFTGTNLSNNASSAQVSYATYRASAYGRVDGKWANDIMDVRVLAGSETYASMAAAFRSDNAGDRAALEDLMDATGGVRVSAHVPAKASKKQNTLFRLGMRMDAVAPVWEGVTIIPDEITKAANGQIVITAVMLYAFKLLRNGGFHKQEFQLDA